LFYGSICDFGYGHDWILCSRCAIRGINANGAINDICEIHVVISAVGNMADINTICAIKGISTIRSVITMNLEEDAQNAEHYEYFMHSEF